MFKRRKRKDATQAYLDQIHSSYENSRTHQLLDELIAIGRSRGFQRSDSRTRAIGAELHRMGGMNKMLEVHTVVADQLGSGPAASLDSAWHEIGPWLG